MKALAYEVNEGGNQEAADAVFAERPAVTPDVDPIGLAIAGGLLLTAAAFICFVLFV
ncbi:MAG TPA: hypothetical protein VH598_16360 [Verrucomicrobiae bacterium]|nr:hypothetical protein [Verrucomicrobiae bacterium]